MKYIKVKSVKPVGIRKKYSLQNNEKDFLDGQPNFLAEGLVSHNSKHACVHKNMKVLTNKGYKKISDIETGDRIAFLDKRENLKVTKKFELVETGRKKTYTVRTKNGNTIRITGDHEFFVMTEKGVEKKRLKDINIGDKVVML